MNLTLNDIVNLLKSRQPFMQKGPVRGISIDSRTIGPDMLFFAIQGDYFDGHDFVDEVFQKGAAAAVVSENWLKGRTDNRIGPMIPVENPLKALQDLAKSYRKQFDIPVIAITGSNGKTTTKEMVAAVLETRFRVLKTEGNQNNHIGLPLTLLHLEEDTDIAVLEMGTNHFGEIKTLCQIADPTYGLITNIGKGHLAFFKDVEGVFRAKSELSEYLKNQGMLILNGDDTFLTRLLDDSGRKSTFGFSENCDLRGSEQQIGGTGLHMMVDGKMKVTLSVPGRHNLYNALAAIAVGRLFQIPDSAIQDALQQYKPSDKRSRIFRSEGITLLDDTYNANPSSIIAALRTLKEIDGLNRTVAVLGDMLELGESSQSEHQKVGEWIVELKYDAFFCFGSAMQHAAERALSLGGQQVFHFSQKDDLISQLQAYVKDGDGMVVKGSRGMRMEEIVEAFVHKETVNH